ncbi:MAG: hypothetical protein EA412_13710 [Chitinophagaceae bacterium]|nr:MAG: hypothetical protein EA412_13710 [Chitinophagaceae bacterium]
MTKVSIRNIHQLREHRAKLKLEIYKKEKKISEDFKSLSVSMAPSKIIRRTIENLTENNILKSNPAYRFVQLMVSYSVENVLFRKKSRTFQNSVILFTQSIISVFFQKGVDNISEYLRDYFGSDKKEKKEKKESDKDNNDDYLGI